MLGLASRSTSLFEVAVVGHFEEGLVDRDDSPQHPMQRGLSKGVSGRVRIAQFNDADSLAEALAPDDVALVLTEPAMTNGIHFLEPVDGWHDAFRRMTRERGTFLAIDETHAHVIGEGGGTGHFGLDPDIVTIGKAVAGGVPMGAYGVTPALAAELDVERNVATGGTLFGNPLSAAAARAAPPRSSCPRPTPARPPPGHAWPTGSPTRSPRSGFPGPRSGSVRAPVSGTAFPEPRTGAEAHALVDMDSDTPAPASGWRTAVSGRRCPGPDPPVRLPTSDADVDRYLDAYVDLLSTLTA